MKFKQTKENISAMGFAAGVECCPDGFEKLFNASVETLENGGTIFFAGNGGSASDCEHICGELLKGFMQKRKISGDNAKKFEKFFGKDGLDLAVKLQNGIRAVSLLSHPAFCSAFGNDVDGSAAFAQQLWALGKKGDLLLGISTGGGAENVKKAFMAAKVMGIKTALLTGNNHGQCEKYSDIIIAVDEKETFKIQERHIRFYHAYAAALENYFFGDEKR